MINKFSWWFFLFNFYFFFLKFCIPAYVNKTFNNLKFMNKNPQKLTKNQSINKKSLNLKISFKNFPKISLNFPSQNINYKNSTNTIKKFLSFKCARNLQEEENWESKKHMFLSLRIFSLTFSFQNKNTRVRHPCFHAARRLTNTLTQTSYWIYRKREREKWERQCACVFSLKFPGFKFFSSFPLSSSQSSFESGRKS